MAKTVRKGKIAVSDVQMTPGNFSRTTSTGGTQTLSGWPYIIVDPNGQYTTVDAAITAAGATKTLIVIPSTYAGAGPSSSPTNITFLDLRGGVPIGGNGGLGVNVTTASDLQSRLRVSQNPSSPTGTTTSIYATQKVYGAVPANQSQIGLAGESGTDGTLTSVGAGAIIVGVEASAPITSDGQTLPDVRGATFNGTLTGTTNITEAFGAVAQAWTDTGAGSITSAYGIMAEAQTVGVTNNYSLWLKGALLQSQGQNWDIIDTGGTPRRFMTPTSDLIIWRPLVDANGVRWADRANSTEWMLLNSSNAYWFDNKFNLNSSGIVARYNNIATVSNGVPVEYAAVNLTAQTAAVGTTTLYAVPASGAGQYRLSWNAKVTTPATTGAATSTLGALTIAYTDPDGVVQTITAAASVAAGTIATTSTGNSTTTVLLGLPLLLNCKLSTNITYAMAYASDTANQMAYNLHIVLEKL